MRILFSKQSVKNKGFKKGNKLGSINRGKKRGKMSEEHKMKIGLANSKALKGRKISEETRKKYIAEQQRRILNGTHNFWKGGKSFEKYTIDWTDILKESIRQRDNFVCRECGIHQEELNVSLDVHHIDYEKKNCDPNNLISLCKSCHMKSNFNREYWTEYFNNLIKEND